MRMTIAQYNALVSNDKKIDESNEKKPNKYNAKKYIVDGIKFDSIAEGKYYEQLKLRKLAGDVSYFHRQVPIELPGTVKLRIDFMIVYPGGNIQYVDVKGVVTQAWRAKQRIVEAIYPFKIEIVRSANDSKRRRRSKRAA